MQNKTDMHAMAHCSMHIAGGGRVAVCRYALRPCAGAIALLYTTTAKSAFTGGQQQPSRSLHAQVGITGTDASKVQACYGGYEGEALLRKSGRSAEVRGVVKSCTIYIGGEYRCTHDDDQWYDCPGGAEVDDFVATICSEYWQLTGSWAPACSDAK